MYPVKVEMMQDLRFLAVLWDIDGVLIDSEPLHYKSLLAASQDMGLKISPEDNTAMLGLGLPDVWARIQSCSQASITMTEWIDRITEYYLSNVCYEMVRAGVHETIELLRKADVRMGCVSSAERIIVEANLKAIRLYHRMDCIISREDVERTKPNPDPYVVASQMLGVKPHDCLVIEDTAIGIAAAKAAGMTVIAYPHQLSDRVSLTSADEIVDDLSQAACFSRIMMPIC